MVVSSSSVQTVRLVVVVAAVSSSGLTLLQTDLTLVREALAITLLLPRFPIWMRVGRPQLHLVAMVSPFIRFFSAYWKSFTTLERLDGWSGGRKGVMMVASSPEQLWTGGLVDKSIDGDQLGALKVSRVKWWIDLPTVWSTEFSWMKQHPGGFTNCSRNTWNKAWTVWWMQW